jgi:O-antigen ligase
LWGLFYLVTAQKNFWLKTLALPKQIFWGAGLYFAVIILTILTGSEYGRGFKHLINVAYLLAPLPLAWLALSQWPRLLRYLAPLYGLGLIVAGLMTFKEAGYGLNCVRAKASLGMIELGAVVTQLIPLVFGALILAFLDRNRKLAIFFIVALGGAFSALIANCSRIALLSVPVLIVLMIWGFRRRLGLLVRLALIVAFGVGAILTLKNEVILARFGEIVAGESDNYNNAVRLGHWRKGWEVFLENPILGVGPRAIPNAPVVEHPLVPEYSKRSRPKYYHAHQVFINVLAESGLVGFLGFLALHLAPILVLWPYRRDQNPIKLFWVYGAFCVALQLFFNGLTDSVFTLKPLMYVYWTVTGVALWVVNQPEPETALT